MAKSEYLTAPLKTDRMPRGIPYIVGNEAAERFSYYGMNSILVPFMTHYLLSATGALDVMTGDQADAWYHTFVSLVYGLCVLGAFLADSVLGKYRTILFLSIAYCFGHFALALNTTRLGLVIGLGLIALGAGGIKPCVSANVGDQFGATNQHLLPRVFSWFYFSINIGSAFSTLLIPWLLDPPSFSKFSANEIKDAPALISEFQNGSAPLSRFIWSRFRPEAQQKLTDPSTPPIKQKEVLLQELNSVLIVGSVYESDRFAGVTLSPKTQEVLAQKPTGQMQILLNRLLVADAYPRELTQSPAVEMGESQIRHATRLHGSAIAFGTPGVFMVIATVVFWFGRKKFIHIPPVGLKRYVAQFLDRENLKAIVNLMILMPFAAMFWALWQQNFSSWVVQAYHMDRHLFGIEWLPGQIQTVNPLFVLLMLPLFSYVIYPAVGRFVKVTPLRRFGGGLWAVIFAFLIVGWIQIRIDGGQHPHIIWQILAFVVLTAGEVMLSVTHLEFSYTQAPNKLKSLVMCMYLGSVSLGNVFTAAVNFFIQNPDGTVKLSGASYFFFFAKVMFVTALLFLVIARFYRGRTYIQDESEAQPA